MCANRFYHHTKTLGDLGVLKAQLDLTQKGFIVSWPLSEHAAFDLVITNRNGSRTVQVKTRSLSKSGTLEVRMLSVWKNSRGVVRKQVDRAMIDIYCVYCPETDECYYVKPPPGVSTIKLRVRSPKNGQSKRVRLARDHRQVP
jgi:hypothetical protein